MMAVERKCRLSWEIITQFTMDPNGTVPYGINPKLVPMGFALTLELLEPFHLGTLSVLIWLF